MTSVPDSEVMTGAASGLGEPTGVFPPILKLVKIICWLTHTGFFEGELPFARPPARFLSELLFSFPIDELYVRRITVAERIWIFSSDEGLVGKEGKIMEVSAGLRNGEGVLEDRDDGLLSGIVCLDAAPSGNFSRIILWL